MVRKQGWGEEREVLSAMALTEELISDLRQLKFKANRDVRSITEVAVLKVNESNEIRDICSAICEIPENRVRSNRKEREIENRWEASE